MRHHVKTRKLGRVKKQREALIRSLMISLIRNGRITTTVAKAKELRPNIEKLVTKAKVDSVASKRFVRSQLGNNNIEELNKLFGDIAPKFKERNGGYTRVLKLSPRASDASPMAIIEFVE